VRVGHIWPDLMFKTLYSRRYRTLLKSLIAVRKEQGLTQTDVADRLKVTQSWVSKCERGARRLDVVELDMWCDALGVSLTEFLRRYNRAVG
jgi:transcriptional regulator with XRE-family HTH domain